VKHSFLRHKPRSFKFNR